MTEQTNALTVRADRTRDHLSDLVDRLQNQITPAELVKQLVGPYAIADGASIAETLTAQVRRNPVACALIAAGVAWLMLSEKAEGKSSVRRRPLRRRAAVGKRRARTKNSA